MNRTPIGNVVRSAAWPDREANLRLTQKTRRAVRDQVISTQERSTRQRRNTGFALIGFVCILVLLGPAIWNGFEDLLAGEHLFDLPTVVAFLMLMLVPAMLAALFAVWRGQRDVVHERGGFETIRPVDR